MVAATGCGAATEDLLEGTVEALPCGSLISQIDLGFTGPNEDGLYPVFSSGAGEVWVAGVDFEHGGLFQADVAHTTAYVGAADAPPTYDAGSGEVSHASAEVTLVEGRWTPVTLAAGEHWLWAGGARALVASCDAGALQLIATQPLAEPVESALASPTSAAAPSS